MNVRLSIACLLALAAVASAGISNCDNTIWTDTMVDVDNRLATEVNAAKNLYACNESFAVELCWETGRRPSQGEAIGVTFAGWG